jgi:hypothetical protein
MKYAFIKRGESREIKGESHRRERLCENEEEDWREA